MKIAGVTVLGSLKFRVVPVQRPVVRGTFRILVASYDKKVLLLLESRAPYWQVSQKQYSAHLSGAELH